MYELTSEIT